MTIALSSHSVSNQRTKGTPTPPARVLYILDSYSSCGCLALTDSSLIATSSPEMMLIPR